MNPTTTPLLPHVLDQRICRKCDEAKPTDAFYKGHLQCKRCLYQTNASRYDNPEPTVTERRCPDCDEVKPASEFHRSRRMYDGLGTYCKECAKFRDILRVYGITRAEYEAKLAEQGGKCAICKTSDWPGRHGVPAIDHDHKTGRFRGLLCSDCNVALGGFKDDVVRLYAAIDYLGG